MKTREELIQELEAAYSGDLDPEDRAAVLDALGQAYDAGVTAGRDEGIPAAVVLQFVKDARAEERAAIVAWLDVVDCPHAPECGIDHDVWLMEAVKRGEHRKKKEP